MNQTAQSYIHSEQMSLIDKGSTVSLVGGLFTAFFYTYVLYGKVSSEVLLTWFALIALVYVIRWIVTNFVFRLDITKVGNSYTWEKTYIAGTLIAGLFWGVGSFYIFPENNALLSTVIVLTIGGLAAAASVNYAPSKYIGLAFNFPALLPLSFYFFTHVGDEYFYMGMLVLIFILVIFTSNKIMHEENVKGIMFGIKNDALIDDLKNKILKIENMSGEMTYQASHDLLTGLINRREFEKRLEQVITDVKHHKKNHVLCYLDLDEFKVVNDTCGHVAGDSLLKEITQLLENKIRSTDIIGRLGGDEFGLLLSLCEVEKAREIANELRESIKTFHFIWDGKVFELGVSIGLVEISENTGTLTDVLKAADSACYVAKDLGKNRIHVYEENDFQLTQRLGDMNYSHIVQRSLADDKFVLYAQEIKSTHEGDVKWHCEFLIRMLDENNKIVPPDKFIPAAERYHLMLDVDKWVINKAFSYIKILENKYDDGILCAINLSGQSICDKSLLSYIVEKLDAYDISPNSVCFEVTETAAIANFVHADKLIKILRGMGCKFSLDDFGSGLSSFGYLKKMSVDYLKIDGSFVKSMLESEKDYALVKSINQIGKELGMKTIAEFVENKELYNELKKMGVDFAQGYGISKPQPMDDII